MKKILNILASISLITTGASNVVACGSNHNPNPPKSEIQQLYNQLTSKTFTIQDNYFWGNEANYKEDLLNDLEKEAGIKSQEEKSLLSLKSDLAILNQPGYYNFVVGIGTGKERKSASVTIDWELTPAQETSPDNLDLFNFYTKTWPQETAKYGSNLLSLFYGGWDKTKKSPFWKKGDSLGWWKNDKGDTINNHLSWNDSFNINVKNYLSNLIKDIKMPILIQNMIHVVKPSTIKDSLDITKSYTIPLNNIYLLSHGVKYNLGYYASYDATKSLPQMQSWNINYDTGYNLIQNELSKTTITLLKSGLYKPYTATNNSGYIEDKLSDAGYSSFVADMKFIGNIQIDGTESPIKIYYEGVDLGFTINVIVFNNPF